MYFYLVVPAADTQLSTEAVTRRAVISAATVLKTRPNMYELHFHCKLQYCLLVKRKKIMNF